MASSTTMASQAVICNIEIHNVSHFVYTPTERAYSGCIDSFVEVNPFSDVININHVPIIVKEVGTASILLRK